MLPRNCSCVSYLIAQDSVRTEAAEHPFCHLSHLKARSAAVSLMTNFASVATGLRTRGSGVQISPGRPFSVDPIRGVRTMASSTARGVEKVSLLRAPFWGTKACGTPNRLCEVRMKAGVSRARAPMDEIRENSRRVRHPPMAVCCGKSPGLKPGQRETAYRGAEAPRFHRTSERKKSFRIERL